MRNNSNKAGNARLLRIGFLLLALLAVMMPLSLAEGYNAGSAQGYCVQMGYLYRTAPAMNNGQGVCQFPDGTWCDAQSFYSGQCGPSLLPQPVPGYYYTGSPVGATASSLCQARGGTLQSVHTPYGDVTLCVFPDGSTCDLQSLYSGTCGRDVWFNYAYNWLRAP